MTYTPTPEAIEASSIKPWPQGPSILEITGDDGSELLAILSDRTVRGAIENAGPAAQLFMTELRGLTEAIAAQAKAEALREAAHDLALPGSPDVSYYSGYIDSGYVQAETDAENWLRARAATIEGKNE